MVFDVVLVGFILPFAVLFVAVLGTRRAETRLGKWLGWTLGGSRRVMDGGITVCHRLLLLALAGPRR